MSAESQTQRSTTGGLGSEESKMPVDSPSPVNSEKEEERTLTDHLNKRLLESFLARIDAGTTGFPNLPQPQPKQDKETDEEFT